MDFQTLLGKLEKIEKKKMLTEATLTIQQVQAAEKAAADDAAAKEKQGGFTGFTTWDPKTAGDIALSKLATDNGLPGLINSKGEFVVAGDGTQKPQIAPPNADDMKALSAAGLMPGNTQGPASLTKVLGDPGAAIKNALAKPGEKVNPTQGDRELAQYKQQSANVQGAKSSAEFIKPRLQKLKDLIAKISAPASESISFKGAIARSLVESFNYQLDEAPAAWAGQDQRLQDLENKLGSGKFAKEIAEIKQLMSELADIEDPDVIQTLSAAQAALDKLAAPTAQAFPVGANKDAPSITQTPAQGGQAAGGQSDTGAQNPPGTIDPNKLKRFKELLDKAEGKSAGAAQSAAQSTAQPAAQSAGAAATGKVTWQTIYNANKQTIGDNPNLIKAGQQLKMPDGTTYTVKAGDNLSKIAANYKPKAGSSANPPSVNSLPGKAVPGASGGMMGDIDPETGLPANPMP